jgi:hypothetical protein
VASELNCPQTNFVLPVVKLWSSWTKCFFLLLKYLKWLNPSPYLAKAGATRTGLPFTEISNSLGMIDLYVTSIDCSVSKNSLNLQIERLARTDSDFAAFLHHAGIPCVDLYYGEGFLIPLIQ